MAVVSSLKEHGRVSTNTTGITDNYDENEFNFISARLPAVCSVVTAKPETNTAPPALDKLLDEQPRDSFCWKIAATVGMLGRSYSYDRHGPLIRTSQLSLIDICGTLRQA